VSKQVKVICDTNIWYYLGNGTLDPNLFTGYSLVATFYNFEELITSGNLLTDFPSVMKASRAIVKYSDEQILENAFLYLANMIKPSFEDRRYNYNLGIRNWTEVRAIARQPDGFVLTRELKKEYEKNIHSRTSGGNDIAKLENDFVSTVKAYSK
jgi:hypothetical protein